MGIFGKKDIGNSKESKLSNARKYVETLKFSNREDLDIAIAERIENRIVKEIQYQTVPYGNGGPEYSVMILYDIWAEKARNEKNVNIIER